MIRLMIAAAACAMAVSAPPAAAQTEIEAEGDFVHRSAGAVFPAAVGEFARVSIVRYDPAGDDVSASYNLAAPEGRLLITLYVYPAPPAAAGARAGHCDRVFEQARGEIVRAYGATKAAPVDIIPGRGIPAAMVRRAVYDARMRFSGQEQPVRTEVGLYCYVGGDWLVKYRATAAAGMDPTRYIEEFVAHGPWVGDTAPEVPPAPAVTTELR